MNAQDFKNSILQLAVQGKLVEQRPEEGTAKELLAQIKAEKEQLIKAKKIKKEKTLPEIPEEEIPFEIPESWEWVRLNDVACVNGGYAFKSTNFIQDGVRVIRISDFNENGFVNTKIVRHSYDDSLEMFLLKEKNILLCMTGGTVGKSYFVTNISEPMMTNQRVATIKVIGLIEEYVNLLILAPITQRVIHKNKNSTNDNISMDTINSFLVPVPPLEEQKRIVAKLEEILPYIEQYDNAYTKLESFNKKFPEDMKKSILQMAMQGKLVEQRPEEGTADKLYEQIVTEKTRLIKEGKIKKEKPLAEISEDEIPFEIPESWKWVRLGEISCKLTDGSHNPPPNSGYGYCVISAKNIKNEEIVFSDDERYVDETGFIKENPRTNIKRGDIIMGIIGGSIGNLAIYNHDDKVIAQRSAAIIDTLIDNIYCMKMLQSPYSQYRMRSASGTAQGGVYLGTLKNMLIPLPPLAEQKRIVAKLEQMMPYCDRLIK